MKTFILGLIACVLLVAGPAFAVEKSALVGTWTGGEPGAPIQLQLKADGTGVFADSPLTWKLQGGKLVITEEGETTLYEFTLKGSTLTVSGGDLDEPMVFARGGAAPKSTAPPAAQAPAGNSPRGSAAQFLAGQYSAYSGHSTYSGSYSSEKRGALCSNGTFHLNSETSSSGSSGIAGVHGGDSGRWTAEGDEMRGTLILQFADGRQQRIPYETSMNPKDRSYYGPAVIFDGTNYQRTGDGNCR
jgi:hypothetical protein